MALALYRKYRPATFAEVVGQEHVTEPLRTALAAGRINHAYLFSGPRGCGKTSSARILARSLNCEKGPTPDPCGECASCIALAPEGPGSLDVVELDAASHGGVDDTRDLRDKAFYMPAESRYRVFIIDEAHMVTTQGFNALLKIVEEPPEHLVFIFATTEPEKVLPTIRSRTHHYPFRLLAPVVLRSLLERLAGEEGVPVEPAVFPLVVKAGGGSARDALSLLDQLFAGAGAEGITYPKAVALLGVTDAALLDEMMDALAASDGASVFGVLDKVSDAGHDPRRFGADLLQRLRDLVILQAVPEAAAKGLIDAPEDQLAAMTAQADRLSPGTLTRYAEILHTGLTDMRGTTSPRLVLELLCARMLLPAASLEDGALLQRLERLERRLSIAAGSESAPRERSDDLAQSPAARGSTARPSTAPAGPGTDQDAADPSSATAGPIGGSAATARSAGTPAGPAASGPPSGSVATAGTAGAGAATAGSADAGASGRGSAGTRAGAPTAAKRHDDGLDLPTPPTLSGARSARPALRRRVNPFQRRPTLHLPHRPRPRLPRRRRQCRQYRQRQHRHQQDRIRNRPPAVPGAVGVTDVRRLWSEVLEAVKRHRRTTQILLEQATVTELSGRTLHLRMPTPGLARKVEEPGNAEVLKTALREILGVDWTIRCDTGASGSRETTTGSGGAAQSDLDAPSQAHRPGSTSIPSSAGVASDASARAPVRGRSAGRASRDDGPLDPDDDIPDDYEDARSGRSSGPVVDPEQAAIELLTAQLGARPLDPEA